jgi:menaquinone-specific isochorismate synthase
MLSSEYTQPLRRDDATDARWLLVERVERVLSGAEVEGAAGSQERVVRLAVPAGRINPFGWLREQRLYPKTYWSGRGERTGVAAVGIADVREMGVSEGTGSLSRLLASLPDTGGSGARYYGGARFDALRRPEEEWAAFGAYRFVLPRFELHAGDAETTLVCNLVLPRDAQSVREILEQIEDLELPAGAFGASLPIPVRREDGPDFRGWRQNIERALGAFSEGRLGKVVLARRAEIGFDGELEPTLLLEGLKEATPDCFQWRGFPRGFSRTPVPPRGRRGRERGRRGNEAAWGVVGGRRRAARRPDAQQQRPLRARLRANRHKRSALAALRGARDRRRCRRDEAGAGKASEVQGLRHPQGGRYRRGFA